MGVADNQETLAMKVARAQFLYLLGVRLDRMGLTVYLGPWVVCPSKADPRFLAPAGVRETYALTGGQDGLSMMFEPAMCVVGVRVIAQFGCHFDPISRSTYQTRRHRIAQVFVGSLMVCSHGVPPAPYVTPLFRWSPFRRDRSGS